MGAGSVKEFRCIVCGKHFPPPQEGPCPSCGPDGVLDARFDYDRLKGTFRWSTLSGRPHNIWRYRELLPLGGRATLPPLDVGWTPIVDAPRLAKWVGVQSLRLKDDGRNPTASFKDRASAVGVARATEVGARAIACASTGNAASSLAGMAASVGLPAYIFVPARAPEPKIAQLLIFGATVLRVAGSYEDAYDLCTQACAERGWYNRNCAQNPHLVEGKKTAGLEIAEQMPQDLPDWVAVSVGDGCTIWGVYKGLLEMRTLGLIDRMPRFLGVQAEGSRAIADAFWSERDVAPGGTDTLADSIAVGRPRNWRKALDAVRSSAGSMIAVPDAEILDAMRQTARLGGVFGEPAGVAALAGLRRAVQAGLVPARARCLAVVTGNGLKDTRSAIEAGGSPIDIEPSLEALSRALGDRT